MTAERTHADDTRLLVAELRAVAEGVRPKTWWLWDDPPSIPYTDVLALAHACSPETILSLLAAFDALTAEVGVLAERTRQAEQERDLANAKVENWVAIADANAVWRPAAEAVEAQLAAAREALTAIAQREARSDYASLAEAVTSFGSIARRALAGEVGPPPPSEQQTAVLEAPTENVGAPDGASLPMQRLAAEALDRAENLISEDSGMVVCWHEYTAAETLLSTCVQCCVELARSALGNTAPRSGAHAPSAAPSSTDCETELAVCRAALTDLRRQMEEYRDQGDWPLSKVVDERDAAVEALHRCREDFHAKVSALQAAARAPSSTDGEKP